MIDIKQQCQGYFSQAQFLQNAKSRQSVVDLSWYAFRLERKKATLADIYVIMLLRWYTFLLNFFILLILRSKLMVLSLECVLIFKIHSMIYFMHNTPYFNSFLRSCDSQGELRFVPVCPSICLSTHHTLRYRLCVINQKFFMELWPFKLNYLGYRQLSCTLGYGVCVIKLLSKFSMDS